MQAEYTTSKLSADEIALEAGYRRGHDDGYVDGLGLADGDGSGVDLGDENSEYVKGYNRGYDDGYAEGCMDAEAEAEGFGN